MISKLSYISRLHQFIYFNNINYGVGISFKYEFQKIFSIAE